MRGGRRSVLKWCNCIIEDANIVEFRNQYEFGLDNSTVIGRFDDFDDFGESKELALITEVLS